MAVLQGVAYVAPRLQSEDGSLLIGGMAVAVGVCLMIGLLTPLVAAIFCVGAVALAPGLLAPDAAMFQGRLTIMLNVVTAAAVILVGPGAFSVDARLFGPREIIIHSVMRGGDEG